eukprot:4853824-Ditylum_brightwellii.AAC.1
MHLIWELILHIHDKVSERPECFALQRLGVEITDHHPGWTILCGEVACSNAICHKEVTDVNMS